MKLNYKNRKSDGPKLGQIVAKDLRKQTKHCFAKPTPRPEVSPLVLELPGKKLTDEGCMSMIEGLIETLQLRDGVSANRLEELHLSGNDLTTASLRALSPIFKLAEFDLLDLDLSDNKITIKTDEEVADWAFFLDSLRCCRALRRIDLSRNDLSGARGLECFVRVYAKQPVVDPLELEEWKEYKANEEDKKATDPEADSMATITERSRKMSLSSSATGSMEFMSRGTVLKRRQGLRSIPYIILAECSLTDSGALFLSYFLEKHFYPQQLMLPLKSGPQATQLDEYNEKSRCWGVVYLPNDALTDNGLKLLEKAEEARAEFAGIEEEEHPTNGSTESFVLVENQEADDSSTPSEPRRSPTLPSFKRRTHDNSKRHGGLDIENYRKKIQRSTLEQSGYDSVDLWRCGLKMLAYARVVMFGRAQEEHSPLPVVDRMEPIMQMMSTYLNAASASAPTITPCAPSSTGTIAPSLAATAHSITPCALTSTNLNVPSLPVTECSITPQPPLDYTAVTTLNGSGGKSNLPRTTIPTIFEEDDRHERDTCLPGELPEEIWQQITLQAAGGENVLSEHQQKAIISYARSNTASELEKGDLGKTEAAQLWWILERMGCLAYEVRT
ncbi:uncharacterized protein BKA78DRAFT_351105 [Phyllosticta capitalensis]